MDLSHDEFHPELAAVLESAARLQQLVPDAVLVGGSAAALYARHRLSYDHDHVIADLRDRFDAVLDALERDPEFVTNRVTPGRIILGELGGIETGLRQLIRRRPLETQVFTTAGGQSLTVPTFEETLRIKAYLIVKRNQARDFIDVAALSERHGIDGSAATLAGIDDFYSDETKDSADEPVRAQLVRQLSDPQPKDRGTTRRLSQYKGLNRRWHDWGVVSDVLGELAVAISVDEDGPR